MKMELVKDGEKILMIILRNGNFSEGLNFYTKDEDFVQVSTWNYNIGKKTIPHSHKIFERKANKTQEVIYIKSGKISCDVFSGAEILVKSVFLEEGDIAIIFGGGHSYEILKDGTQVLEIKNGPYPGLKNDKKVISNF